MDYHIGKRKEKKSLSCNAVNITRTPIAPVPTWMIFPLLSRQLSRRIEYTPFKARHLSLKKNEDKVLDLPFKPFKTLSSRKYATFPEKTFLMICE
jgi:hypothetical protein